MKRAALVPIAAVFVALIFFVQPAGPASGASVAAGSAGTTETLAAHRAVYAMSLAKMRAGSEVVGANGLMVMSVERACDGWISAQRIGLTLLDREGNEVSTEANYSSWESLDGKRYRFLSQNRRGGVVADAAKGEGTMGDEGGTAVYEIPAGKRLTLPTGTLFPARHLVELITAAQRGERAFLRPLFDGIGVDGVVDVNSLILSPLSAADAPGIEGPLLRRPGWRVQIAYFGREKETDSPQYEMSAGLLDNGVTQRMTLEYGGFSVEAKLREITALPPPKC